MGDDKEDAALFRSAIGDITPLPDQNRILPKRPVIPAIVKRGTSKEQVPDTLSDYHEGDAPEEYRRNGISRMVLRKLRNSPVEDSLDLHGSTVDGARMLLLQFLSEASLRQLRCIRVIHGKGMNSKGNEAVLRNHARSWLVQHQEVLAFCPAPAMAGGSGAVLVLLRIRP